MTRAALNPREASSRPLSLRTLLEGEIERLIAMLDALDGDHDLEDNADLEPANGQSFMLADGTIVDDCEAVNEDGSEGGDL